MNTDEKDYIAGENYAKWWISKGGSTSVTECPPEWSDAKCNGFCDYLVSKH